MSHGLRAGKLGILLGALVLAASSSLCSASVRLNAAASPSSGVSGSSDVWVTGSGFPAGQVTAAGTTITIAGTCGGTGTVAPTLKETNILGTSDKVEFLVPASLATGTYYVSISGKTSANNSFASGNCSAIAVTHTATALSSCNPGSSMGILTPSSGAGPYPVTVYVPQGYWDLGTGGTGGIYVVPLEGSGSLADIVTPGVANSCSSDSGNLTTVCTANNTDIYLVNGSSLTTTLTSGSNSYSGFSGGECMNCGVAVNSVTHQAVIQMGWNGAPSGSGVQFLDLTSNTLGSVVPLQYEASEDILWDPFYNEVLSPNEDDNYDILKIAGSGLPGPTTVAEYANNSSTNPSFSSVNGEFDSAGEDCTTHIALATDEFGNQLFLSDLTQATLVPGSPFGTWSSPGTQAQTIPELGYLSAGPSAVAVAPGSSHQGVVAGEFGGNAVVVIQLPSTSGSGVPAVLDWVLLYLYDASGNYFSNGYDPHTSTAYTSPNNGKAYGVMADWGSTSLPTTVGNNPNQLAIIDLQAALSSPLRSGNTIPNGTDLIGAGIVRFVPTN